jgi:hypothetical protein
MEREQNSFWNDNWDFGWVSLFLNSLIDSDQDIIIAFFTFFEQKHNSPWKNRYQLSVEKSTEKGKQFTAYMKKQSAS